MTRAKLRAILNAAGVRTGTGTNAATATIVEFVEFWGLVPGIDPTNTDPAIEAALAAAGVPWTRASMILVSKGAGV